jgi:hypothetical protein
MLVLENSAMKTMNQASDGLDNYEEPVNSERRRRIVALRVEDAPITRET